MKILFSDSFIRGFTKVLNLGGTKEWPHISEDFSSDYEALRSDWNNVGKSIWEAASSYEAAQTVSRF